MVRMALIPTCQHPDFQSQMPVMSYLAIPGLPFLRDITELDTIVLHPLQRYISSYTNRDLMIQFLIQLRTAEYVIITVA